MMGTLYIMIIKQNYQLFFSTGLKVDLRAFVFLLNSTLGISFNEHLDNGIPYNNHGQKLKSYIYYTGNEKTK